MTKNVSTALSVATTGYPVFALANPRHLGKALTANPLKQGDYDLSARVFGARDLVVSALAIFAPTSTAPEHAMVARVIFDLTDASMFTPQAQATGAKAKILGATLMWAALNATAIVLDRR